MPSRKRHYIAIPPRTLFVVFGILIFCLVAYFAIRLRSYEPKEENIAHSDVQNICCELTISGDAKPSWRTLLSKNGATQDDLGYVGLWLWQQDRRNGPGQGEKLRVYDEFTSEGSSRPIYIELHTMTGFVAALTRTIDGWICAQPQNDVLPDGDQQSVDDEKTTLASRLKMIADDGRYTPTQRRLFRQAVSLFALSFDLDVPVHQGDSFYFSSEEPPLDKRCIFSKETTSPSNADSYCEALEQKRLFSSAVIGIDRKFFKLYGLAIPGTINGYFDEKAVSAIPLLLRKPIAAGRLKRHYGLIKHPILNYFLFHEGNDYEASAGQMVSAAGNGTITKIENQENGIRTIQITHDENLQTFYGGLAIETKFGVLLGKQVKQGDPIGYVKGPEDDRGAFLHYGVRKNGCVVDSRFVELPREKPLSGDEFRQFDLARNLADVMRQAKSLFSTILLSK